MTFTFTIWQFLTSAVLLLGGICAISYSLGVRAERKCRDLDAPPRQVAAVARILEACRPLGPAQLVSYEIEFDPASGLRLFFEATVPLRQDDLQRRLDRFKERTVGKPIREGQ